MHSRYLKTSHYLKYLIMGGAFIKFQDFSYICRTRQQIYFFNFTFNLISPVRCFSHLTNSLKSKVVIISPLVIKLLIKHCYECSYFIWCICQTSCVRYLNNFLALFTSNNHYLEGDFKLTLNLHIVNIIIKFWLQVLINKSDLDQKHQHQIKWSSTHLSNTVLKQNDLSFLQIDKSRKACT